MSRARLERFALLCAEEPDAKPLNDGGSVMSSVKWDRRVRSRPGEFATEEVAHARLIVLTPGTSFNSASAEGIVEERIILYRMLTEVWGDLGHNARRVFLGGLSSVARFREYESWYPDREIDASFVEQFRSAVEGHGAELHREFIRVRDLLADGLDNEAWRQRQRFVGKLRRLLAHACLDALEADLVILDEFQRFRDLLNPKTTSGQLAHRLFEYEDSHTKVRTLLLSATPYKMYTPATSQMMTTTGTFCRRSAFWRDATAPWNRLRRRCVSSLAAAIGRFG